MLFSWTELQLLVFSEESMVELWWRWEWGCGSGEGPGEEGGVSEAARWAGFDA